MEGRPVFYGREKERSINLAHERECRLFNFFGGLLIILGEFRAQYLSHLWKLTKWMLLNYSFLWITYITDWWDWALVKLSVIVIIMKSIIVQGWYFRRCPWVATNAWEMGRVCGGKCHHQKSANNLIFQIIFHLVFSFSILIINNTHWRKDLPMQAVWLQK